MKVPACCIFIRWRIQWPSLKPTWSVRSLLKVVKRYCQSTPALWTARAGERIRSALCCEFSIGGSFQQTHEASQRWPRLLPTHLPVTCDSLAAERCRCTWQSRNVLMDIEAPRNTDSGLPDRTQSGKMAYEEYVNVTPDGGVKKRVISEGSGEVAPLHAQCLGEAKRQTSCAHRSPQ